MKKSFILAFSVMTSILIFSSAAAADNNQALHLHIKDAATHHKAVFLSGQYEGRNAPVRLIDGTLYMIGEAVGAYFEFTYAFDPDTETDTLTVGDVQVKLMKHVSISKADEELKLKDSVREQLSQGYVPLREVFEWAGYDVSYQPATRTVSIKPSGSIIEEK
ncbi:stalk domain-containing protein [Paenibacillus taichungensis]|uniref:stalk domain-containing protein n=1 Tax=Paenibacillus taichungensis TaxID=484184 RepID=UPI0035D71746